MNTSTKALKNLKMKHALQDRRAEVSKLTNEDKLYYGNWLNAQDENHYDSVNELGGELSFNDNSFEDGLETTSKNYE
jgi:hypothetical protein